MDDIAKRVANLSPTKRSLLELKLRKKVAAKFSEGQPGIEDITRRIASLSAAKRTLLELKLRKKVAAKFSEGQPGLESVVWRIADLSVAKRRLLELKFSKKAASPVKSPEPTTTTDDIVHQIANLSPAKRALLELRLKKQSIGTISTTVSPSPVVTTVPDAPEEISAEFADAPFPSTPDAQIASEPETPDWLTDTVTEDVETPSWLLDEISTPEEVGVQTPPEPVEFSEAESPPAGDQMVGLKEGVEEGTASSSDLDILNFDEEPEAPAWLTESEDTALFSDKSRPDHQAASSSSVAPTPTASKPGWLESLRPTTEAVTEEDDNKTAEATGMLAGISTLLPAEKVSIPTLEADSLQQAAQEFYKLATEASQPVVFPTPLTHRERIVGGAVRSVLYLLFIVLIAVPLLPGAQKVVDNITVPWSEPTGNAGDVLDGQRRQLISEQLGIIDVQQPGSIALVSFDYSAATQGEMQPLADAILGRLKGQGMRIISVSLEPEGTIIAQNTLEKILAERDELYGADMINLGYLPGQVAAVRRLVADQEALLVIPDIKENLTLKARSEWADIQNLDQVNIIVTFADNPTTVRWWVEQLEAAPQSEGDELFLLAATSAIAEPFLRPYRESEQLDGLISGINGAAAIEAGRNRFESARQMIDSLGIATIIIVILITAGTIVGWMPTQLSASPVAEPDIEQEIPVADEESGSSE